MRKKRLFSFILSLCMVITICGMSTLNVFAAERIDLTKSTTSYTFNEGENIYIYLGKEGFLRKHEVINSNNKTVDMKSYDVHSTPYSDMSQSSSYFELSPGKYTVKCTISGYDLKVMGGQYYAIPKSSKNTVTRTLIIKDLPDITETISFPSKTVTYDGTEQTLTVSNIPEGATVSYESNTADKNSAINPGTYTITAVIRKDGYAPKRVTSTLTIKKRDLVIVATGADKTYDGKITTNISVYMTGKVAGDDVRNTYSWPSIGVYTHADVGENLPVTISNNTYYFIGDDVDKYNIIKPSSLTGTISPAPITIKAKDIQMIKGDPYPDLEYEITEGVLFGADTITGTLSTNATGNQVGEFDITQGSLSVSSNYDLTFKKGIFSVVEKEKQNIVVSDIPSTKTYGDVGFKIDVTPDDSTGLDKIDFSSSNTDVAEVDANGNVTIKNAGTTTLQIFQAGNDTYAPFKKVQELVVKKVPITINADEKTKKVGTNDPALTYQYTGTLVGTDEFTGELKRAEGEAVGKYDILQNTLKINDNYEITYNKATFEILDKTPQNITVADFGDKTYGDEAFKVTVTPDATSNLSNFTYTSDNENVATISADGTITIVGAGEANITVTEAGNDEYAKTPITKKLTVSKKAVGVTSIDTENKTAVLDDILESDKENATLDFDKITLEIGDAVDETTSNAVLTNFVLKGDKAANYNITTESLSTTIANDNVVTVTITAENGTATGAAKYLKDSEVTVTATPNSGYKFSGWYNGDTSVSTSESYTFKAESDTALTAKFSKKSSGGGGGGSSVSTYTVKFETNGGSKIDNIKVDKNKTVTEPTIPAKDGFEFAGWYTDKELTTAYDFDTKVTKSFTLYAAWTENQTEVKDDNTEPTEPTTPENKITFTDVKENEWFAENVKYVFENGLMNGVTSTEFAPNANLTRGMLVTVLYRAEGEPAVNKSIPFADVNADDYFANAVTWAQQNGIVKGVSETEFAPDDFITREQIAAIIYRYANYKGYDTSAKSDISAYADAGEISEYAVEAIQYAVGSGLMKGKTETTLNPKDNATRAEIAAILQRFIKANK